MLCRAICWQWESKWIITPSPLMILNRCWPSIFHDVYVSRTECSRKDDWRGYCPRLIGWNTWEGPVIRLNTGIFVFRCTTFYLFPSLPEPVASCFCSHLSSLFPPTGPGLLSQYGHHAQRRQATQRHDRPRTQKGTGLSLPFPSLLSLLRLANVRVVTETNLWAEYCLTVCCCWI